VFSDPGIPDGEETDYRGAVGEQVGGQIRVRVEHAGTERYRQVVDARLLGAMDYSAEVCFIRGGGTLVPESYRFETRNGDRRVALEEASFTGVTALTFGFEVGSYPDDLVPWVGCLVAWRGLAFARGMRFSFPIWLANTVFWEVAAKVDRRERIEVPAGSFDAWRVAARPSFVAIAEPLDRVVRMVLPAFHLHFDAEHPHRALRLAFPTGPFPWNRRGLMEATAVR
jgi:hypothetical protein